MNKRKKVAKRKQRQTKKRFESLQKVSTLPEPTAQERHSRRAVSNVKQSSSQATTATSPAKSAKSAHKVELEAPLKPEQQADEIESSAITDESSNKRNAGKLKKADQPDSASKEKPKQTRTTSKKSAEEENPKPPKRPVKKAESA
jgi:hypothetical protein